MMPILPYRKPQRLNTISEVYSILKKSHVRRVLLVTGKHVRSCRLTEPLETMLQSNGIQLHVYDRTVSNPTVRNVEEALQMYLKNNRQGIIGFGGGSPIDCAKAVGARAANPRKSLGNMKGLLKVRRPLPLLIAVPTTAGSGSEATIAAVITNPRTNLKYPINDFALIPRYALLDAEVTKTLPPDITAATGMDALTHAVEAYIGHSTTAETRADSIKAVQRIFRWLPRAFRDGADTEARRQMLYASYLAGCAFTKSYVGYVHAVAHSLGGQYNIPHGLANAILLPVVLEAYEDAAVKKLHILGIAIGAASKEVPHREGAAAFIRSVRQLKQTLQIGDTIPEIHEKDIPSLAKKPPGRPIPFIPSPG